MWVQTWPPQPGTLAFKNIKSYTQSRSQGLSSMLIY